MAVRFGRRDHVAVGSTPQRCNLRVPIKKLMVIAGLLAGSTFALADPSTTTPDPPQRKTIPRVGPAGFTPSWNLDGLYLWIGPSGAGSHVEGEWDSTFGADAAVMRVREREAIGAIGGSLGASKWTVRDGGRIWVDALIGTRVLGRMIGVSAGPIVELSELAHPKLGGSIGVWSFVGITPFARVGTIQDLGVFGEVGVHIALPVLRRR
jgi:hypothetical protein